MDAKPLAVQIHTVKTELVIPGTELIGNVGKIIKEKDFNMEE